jgi:hypothetical protein
MRLVPAQERPGKCARIYIVGDADGIGTGGTDGIGGGVGIGGTVTLGIGTGLILGTGCAAAREPPPCPASTATTNAVAPRDAIKSLVMKSSI